MTANKATPEELDRIAETCARSLFGSFYDESDKIRVRSAIDQALALAAADLIESLVQKKGDMRNAIFAYDAAIRSCANEPEKMASFCTAEGDNLDTLYAAMIDAAKAEPDAH